MAALIKHVWSQSGYVSCFFNIPFELLKGQFFSVMLTLRHARHHIIRNCMKVQGLHCQVQWNDNGHIVWIFLPVSVKTMLQCDIVTVEKAHASENFQVKKSCERLLICVNVLCKSKDAEFRV